MGDIKATIGQNLNAQLATQDIKQKTLAKELGVTDNTISYYCAGKRAPSLEQLVKIADFLNVSVDTLLGRPIGQTDQDSLMFASKFTGLSVQAVLNIKRWTDLETIGAVVNSVLSSSACEKFVDCLAYAYHNANEISEYLRTLNCESLTDDEKSVEFLNLAYFIKELRFSKFEVAESASNLISEVAGIDDLRKAAKAKKDEIEDVVWEYRSRSRRDFDGEHEIDGNEEW